MSASGSSQAASVEVAFVAACLFWRMAQISVQFYHQFP